MEYTTFSLDNGLKVIHQYSPDTIMVLVNVLYDVGARDESPELTGMAHLFEHLMFGGSVNVPDFDAELERAGGLNNAWTSNDFTNFYDILPAQNIEVALRLESDRMLSLAFTPKSLEVQRNVVIEEFKETCLNRPFGDLGHKLRSLIYKVHPYSYPTIGKDISHIEKVTLDDVKDFFYSHYTPSNAILTIAGNITLEETKRLVNKWFGDIPRRKAKKRHTPQEPLQTEPRRQDIIADEPLNLMVMAYPMGGYKSEDYIISDLLTDILSSGRASRFCRTLEMNDIFSSADASIMGSEDPGFVMITATLENNDFATAEKLINEQLDRIKSGDITERELQRAINRYDSERTFSFMNFTDRANNLTFAVYHSEDPDEIAQRYHAVTLEKLTEGANRIFDNNKVSVLTYTPEK